MNKKLVALLLLIGVIPVLVSFLVWRAAVEDNLKQDFDRLNTAKVQAIQSDVTALYDMHMAVLKLLARSAAVRGFDLENVKPVLADMEKTYPMFIPVAVDRDGRQVVKTATYSMSGIADRRFYIQAMSGKEEVLSEVVVSRSTGLATVILATPIYGDNGTVTGVMQGSINLLKLTDFVKQRSEGVVTAFIVDKEGKIMAHPNKELVAERKDVAGTGYFQKGAQGLAGVEESIDDKGNKALVYFAGEKKTGWVVCVETPAQLLLERSAEATRRAVPAVLAALLVVLAIGYSLLARSVAPVQQNTRTKQG